MSDLYRAATFEAFWASYQQLHSRRATRVLHLAATASAGSLLVAGAATGNVWLIAAAPLADWGIAQASHRVFERNRTQPYRHLRWHVRAELRMARDVAGSLASGLVRRRPRRFRLRSLEHAGSRAEKSGQG